MRDVETRRQELRTKVLLGMKVFYVEIICTKRFLCCTIQKCLEQIIVIKAIELVDCEVKNFLYFNSSKVYFR